MFTLSILQTISVIIASLTAIYGITSWRREATWKRKYELIEEMLSTFYEISDAFEFMRNPIGDVEEGKTRKRHENETKRQSEILDMAYVMFERYHKKTEPFAKVQSLKYRFMAVFGKETEQYFNQIFLLRNKLLSAASRLGNTYWMNQGEKEYTEEQFKKHLIEMEKYERLFWSGHPGEDEFKTDVDNVIENIKQISKSINNRKLFSVVL